MGRSLPERTMQAWSADGTRLAPSPALSPWTQDAGMAPILRSSILAQVGFKPQSVGLIPGSMAAESRARYWLQNTESLVVFSAAGQRLWGDGLRRARLAWGQEVVYGMELGTRTIEILDLETGQRQRSLGPYEAGGSLALSPDGRRLALSRSNFASDSRGILLIDATTGAEIASIGDGVYLRVAFSPDGRRLAAAPENGERIDWFEVGQ